MQYTIEERQLTNQLTHRPSHETEPRSMVIEADDADEAISQFVGQNSSELVSVVRPGSGQESIVTVRKDDGVYLLRVYAA